MGVYLGINGRILIRRNSGSAALLTVLQGSDVNIAKRRFSVIGAQEQFITGDRVEITTMPEVDEIPLTLVPSNVDSTGQLQSSYAGFVHVDALGGMRFYTNIDDAIQGSIDNAVELGDVAAPGLEVSVEVAGNDDDHCLGHVRDFTITTSRENIDTTCLSEQFKHSYENGLIQGQGQVSCFWNYPTERLGAGVYESSEQEFAAYLAKLCIRVVQGATFHGFFYLYYSGAGEKSVWYECERCIVNNVVISVQPDQLVQAEISFITSGQINLKEGYVPGYLELEQDSDLILNEDGYRISLENPES